MNSFVSSVELIQAMTYKLKRDTNQNFEKLTYNFKMRETWNNTCASTTLNIRKKIVKIEIITMVITQNVMRTKKKKYIYIYIYLAEFLKTYLKMDQNIRTESWR